jgi:aminopeptidase N
MSLDFIGYDIASVTVDGLAAGYRREGDKLVVELPRRIPVGEAFSIIVSYRGKPENVKSPYVGFVEHLGLHFPDGESLFAVSEPDGARYWFPTNDHPRDKAVFHFEIVVPEGLTAVANGQLLASKPGILPDGRNGELFIWEHNHPMAPYLAVVAVGPYERMDDTSPAGVPLVYYTFPELRDEVIEATSEVGEAIDWMSEMLGPYPFESFGYVTARLPGASMESQTMVLFSDVLIGKRTAVHELAHMWFGDWVSLDSWSEMWRNEGFATYIQLLWETRNYPENMAPYLENWRTAVENSDKNYPLDNPPPEYLLEFNVYYEGALAVHALRQEMGDEAFFNGLRSYFERFGGGTASDEDFRSVMEEAAGRSLETFFSQWFPGG